MSMTTKPLYGTAGQTLTCTLASLGNGSARSSAAVDNTSALLIDAWVQLTVKSAGSGTSASGVINVYAYASVDGGTTYPEGCGTNTGITLTSPTNLRLIGVINVVANSTSYSSEPMSVAAAFGSVLPAFWGIAIENKSGGALDSTEGNHAKLYQGMQIQTV